MSKPENSDRTRVIVVDDDQLVRDFTVTTIEYGIDRPVSTFENGFDAWQFLQADPDAVDTIIADANIPEIDGMELLEKVKAKWPDKIFIVSASDAAKEETAYQLGANAFLAKPYSVDDLFAIIQQFIADPQASTPSAEKE